MPLGQRDPSRSTSGARAWAEWQRRIPGLLDIGAAQLRGEGLPQPWFPKEGARGGPETFELVVFCSYEIEELAPYLGETRARIGDATWMPLDRATVEVLVGGELWG